MTKTEQKWANTEKLWAPLNAKVNMGTAPKARAEYKPRPIKSVVGVGTKRPFKLTEDEMAHFMRTAPTWLATQIAR